MKHLFTLILSILFTAILSAQVNVTFKVDITDYLAAGNTVGANGMRISGNFADCAAMNDGNNMAQWNPSDASCAMVNETGTNIWTITVTYGGIPVPPTTTTQEYIFINSDESMVEGLAGSQIVNNGCGQIIAGTVKRIMEIPLTDVTLEFCWDNCTPCASIGFESVNTGTNLTIYPNPTHSEVTFGYSITASALVKFELYNSVGQLISIESKGILEPGNYIHTLSTEILSEGMYSVKLITGNTIKIKTMIVLN
jgi:hypothetical protein